MDDDDILRYKYFWGAWNFKRDAHRPIYFSKNKIKEFNTFHQIKKTFSSMKN